MIDPAIKTLIHAAPGMFLATRNASYVPALTRPQAARFSEDETEMTLVLVKAVCQPSLANLQQNGQLAFTACDIENYKTYQFKGRFKSVAEASHEEMALKEIYLLKFENLLVSQGYPTSFVEGFRKVRAFLTPAPAWALKFEIAEIFDQTPGPLAGKSVWKGEA